MCAAHFPKGILFLSESQEATAELMQAEEEAGLDLNP